jgi:hypothetical protein
MGNDMTSKDEMPDEIWAHKTWRGNMAFTDKFTDSCIKDTRYVREGLIVRSDPSPANEKSGYYIGDNHNGYKLVDSISPPMPDDVAEAIRYAEKECYYWNNVLVDQGTIPMGSCSIGLKHLQSLIRAASTPSAEVQSLHAKIKQLEDDRAARNVIDDRETAELEAEVRALREALEAIIASDGAPKTIQKIATDTLNQTSKSVINKVGEKS